MILFRSLLQDITFDSFLINRNSNEVLCFKIMENCHWKDREV